MPENKGMFANEVTVSFTEEEAVLFFKRVVPTYNAKQGKDVAVVGSEIAEEFMVQMSKEKLRKVMELVNNYFGKDDSTNKD